MDKAKAVIIGATGYGGAELLRSLLFHPHVEVIRTTAVDNIGKQVGEVHLSLASATDLVIEQLPPREAAAGADIVFMALPHKTTAKVAMELFDTGVRIVDLSGDFRLQDVGLYEKFYGARHPCPDALPTYAYGMPELDRQAIRQATRIASPGCFATAITFALLAAARGGLVSGPVPVVAATGSSGSGAEPKITTHHPLRAGNLRTYKPLWHQHTPEIEQTLRAAGAGAHLRLQFVPISAPLVRGIFVTSFVDVPEDFTEDDARALYGACWQDEPFVRVVEGRQPEVIAVAGSMYTEVGFSLEPAGQGRGRTLACFAALDNLVKGGAGQAVQATNVMMGWPETAGIDRPAAWP
jgi:N-acetyl-gamma-glutamyl-phosphate reductase